jgi:hypothetical protein
MHTVAPAIIPVITIPTEPVVTHEDTLGELTLSVGESKKRGTLTLTVVSLRGDSRCPEDVQCIQKGDVSVEIKVEDEGVTETKIIKTDTPVTSFGSHLISISAVTPIPNSKKIISIDEYRITFLISK